MPLSSYQALEDGNAPRLRRLLKFGLSPEAEPPATSEEYITPIGLAVWSRRTDLVQIFLDQGVSASDGDGIEQSLLGAAVESDDLAMIAFLVAKGANVNDADGSSTSLEKGIREHRIFCIQLLLAKGANPNGKTSSDETFLHLAQSLNDHQAEILLINAGAKPPGKHH